METVLFTLWRTRTLNKVGDKLVPSKTQIVNQLTGKSMSRKEATMMARTVKEKLKNTAEKIKELPKKGVETVVSGTADGVIKKKRNNE